MDMRWSLEELHSSFDSHEFKDDFAKVDLLIDQMRKMGKEILLQKTNLKKRLSIT